MGTRNKTIPEFFIRGSDVWHGRVSMAIKSFGLVSTISFVAAIVSFAVWLFVFYSSMERAIFWYYNIAKVETMIGVGTSSLLARKISISGVDPVTLLPYQIINVTSEAYNNAFGAMLYLGYFAAIAAFVLSFMYLTKFYTAYGKKQGEAEFIRGSYLVEPEELSDLVKSSKQGAGKYCVAGVPIPAGVEMRNFAAIGSMGTGKTQVILDLADQVFRSGKKSIVWDKTGEFTRIYYRPGIDVILNPFDKRFPGWNIFSEIDHVFEFDQIAYSLCPNPENANSTAIYFAGGARKVMASVLRKLWETNRRSTKDFADAILKLSRTEIAELIEGTAGAQFVAPDAAEQAAGVMSTLLDAVEFLKYVPYGSFSIKEWVVKSDDSRLFITSHETINDLLKPLASAYLDIAIRAAMTVKETPEDRLWLWLDELASLDIVPILKVSLTEARKYGVVHIIGMQNIAQLRSIYGKDIAQTLRANIQSYLVCRTSDEETQKTMSALLGEQEIDDQSEGLSFGVTESRDGSNVQTSRKELKIVLSSEIKMLPDCTGFLQLAGDYPVAKVAWPYKPREHVSVGFEIRPDLSLAEKDKQSYGPVELDINIHL